MERAFNLIDEPWICVRTADCEVQEVSLRDALLRAHEYRELAGETKTQDFAVMRLLLAVIYTAFSRYTLDGETYSLSEDPDLALDQWETIWKEGKLSAPPIERYLNEWHDRFWLFDDAYPFYQSRSVFENRKEAYGIEKMIGTVSQSENKRRLFQSMNTVGTAIGFAEAARWLVNFMNFSDKSYKNKYMKIPNRTWTSKLCLVAIKGATLFQSLMLNYVADYSGENTPTWETEIQRQAVDDQHMENSYQVPIPKNQAALLTLQSRQIFLCHNESQVTGYYVAGGDYFEGDDITAELMTLWNGFHDKKTDKIIFKPKTGRYLARAWQEFGSLSRVDHKNDTGKGIRMPGVVIWIKSLLDEEILDKTQLVTTELAAVVYDEDDQKSLCIKDTISDSLTFHAQLLQDVGYAWREHILTEIDNCEKAARAVYQLYKQLQNACGRHDKDGKTEQSGEASAKAEFYERIDRPFRLWLAKLDPETMDDAYMDELERKLLRIALRLGEELASQSGSSAIFGRYLKPDKENGNGEITSSAQALNAFSYRLRNQIFIKAGDTA